MINRIVIGLVFSVSLFGVIMVVLGWKQHEPARSGIEDGPRSTGDTAFSGYIFNDDGQTHDLSTGEHLVAMLSATCDHCKASVPFLNDLALVPEFPPLIAFILGSEAELQDFRLQTEPLFPAFLVGMEDFFKFIESSPPRLMYVRGGEEVNSWDWEEKPPSLDSIIAAVEPQ